MTADVVIAGAGIAGIATAYQLAQDGITDIVVVDPRPPLTLTSSRTGANYRDWWPSRPMVELARRSIHLMSAIVESGAPATMNRRGYLYVSTRPQFASELEFLAPYRQAGAGPIRIHSSPGAADYQVPGPDGLQGPEGADVLTDIGIVGRTFGYLSPEVTGVVHARNAGTVDIVALGQHLLAGALRLGVRVVRGEVVRIELTRGRVSGVGISSESGLGEAVATRHFVNAAGPFAGTVAGLMNVSLPVINVLQQKVALPDPLGAVPVEAPFTVSLDPVGSLPPGLHIKRDTLGGKPVIKLGCAYNKKPEAPEWDARGTAEFPGRVLRAATQLIPAIEPYLDGQSIPIAHEAGYYTRTPDDLPLIGPLGSDGAFVVGGLAGYGGMVACGCAEIASAWIRGATRPAWSASFDPDRFRNAAQVAPSLTDTTSGAL